MPPPITLREIFCYNDPYEATYKFIFKFENHSDLIIKFSYSFRQDFKSMSLFELLFDQFQVQHRDGTARGERLFRAFQERFKEGYKISYIDTFKNV